MSAVLTDNDGELLPVRPVGEQQVQRLVHRHPRHAHTYNTLTLSSVSRSGVVDRHRFDADPDVHFRIRIGMKTMPIYMRILS